ncbi:MAG: hypothetical protein JW915_10225 [Chitinispirillaceae bacterium]|nr:hypothetical protein [Chitinispirillaceae bacterium]
MERTFIKIKNWSNNFVIHKISCFCYFILLCILIVTCEHKQGISDIVVTDSAPTADAGTDTAVGLNDIVHLHGIGSDSDGHIVKYEWKFGNDVWKTTSTGDTIIIAPAIAQTYACSLRVTDDNGLYSVDVIIITVTSSPPIADAGKDVTVYIGSQLRLHGTGTDTDGYVVKYEWKLDTADWVITATGDTTVTVPSTAQILNCFFRVTDDDGLSNDDSISITVTNGVIDIDGNSYNVITIGNQTWLAENLKVTHYNDGNAIPNVSNWWGNLDSGACCFYDNDSSMGDIYGLLYNGYAIETGKLAPEGWHVPTDADWTQLEENMIANGYNWDGTTTGNKIGKAMAATTGWITAGSDGSIGYNMLLNNLSGFTALPGGWRHFSGRCNSIGNFCAWWSATATGQDHLYYRSLISQYANLIKGGNSKTCGKYVRLVKD